MPLVVARCMGGDFASLLRASTPRYAAMVAQGCSLADTALPIRSLSVQTLLLTGTPVCATASWIAEVALPGRPGSVTTDDGSDGSAGAMDSSCQCIGLIGFIGGPDPLSLPIIPHGPRTHLGNAHGEKSCLPGEPSSPMIHPDRPCWRAANAPASGCGQHAHPPS